MGPIKAPVKSPPDGEQSPARSGSPVRPIDRIRQTSPVRPIDPVRPSSPVRPISPGTPRSPVIPRRPGKRTPSTSSRSSHKDANNAPSISSDNKEKLATEVESKNRRKPRRFWASLCCCFPCCEHCYCTCCAGRSGTRRPVKDSDNQAQSDGQGQSGGHCPTCRCHLAEDTPAKYSTEEKSGPRVEFDDAIFVENAEPRTRDAASGPGMEAMNPVRNSVQTAKRGRRK